MRFQVRRASSYDDEVPPCEGAIAETFQYEVRRTLRNTSEASIASYARNGFHRDGREMVKTITGTHYVMDVPDLEALLQLGRVIVDEACDIPGLHTIIIYDDYVE